MSKRRTWTAAEQRAIDAMAVQAVRGVLRRKDATARLVKLLTSRSAGSIDARLGWTMAVYRKKHGISAAAPRHIFGPKPLQPAEPDRKEQLGPMTLNLFGVKYESAGI